MTSTTGQVQCARLEVFFWLSLALKQNFNLNKVRNGDVISSNKYRRIIKLAYSKGIIDDTMKDDAKELDRLINQELPDIYQRIAKSGAGPGRNLLGGHPGVYQLLSRAGRITDSIKSAYDLPEYPKWPPSV